jgi:glyoxylase-like metal-dependent hydrolase (beta-lactamase superfamily II)
MIQIQSFVCNPYQENTYLLFDETKACVIVDPGVYTSAEQNELTGFIKANELKPVKLLNTHCHIDHVLGNQYVASTYNLLPEFHALEQEVLNAIPAYAPQMGIRYELSPLPANYLEADEIISFGNSVLEIIFAEVLAELICLVETTSSCWKASVLNFSNYLPIVAFIRVTDQKPASHLNSFTIHF